ncbi:hypothetical protein KC357_g62 [Hortaea werneckii]|nr:hypothetical protein KC357_g62 [Hortaea werneckii]
MFETDQRTEDRCHVEPQSARLHLLSPMEAECIRLSCSPKQTATVLPVESDPAPERTWSHFVPISPSPGQETWVKSTAPPGARLKTKAPCYTYPPQGSRQSRYGISGSIVPA